MADKNDRLFVRDGLRHYRRSYSLTEVRVGVLILLGLVAIALWVAWRGGQGEAELFSAAPGQVQRAVVVGESTGQQGLEASGGARKTAVPQSRGTAPDGLAPDGWTEREVTTFGPENVYEKINGREGYYKSFGFQSMTFVALELGSDPSVSVDIELYDQGSLENALGAFAGELPPEAEVSARTSGLGYRARNAMFSTHGNLYVRVVGSDESPAVQSALDHIGPVLERSLPSEPLPWAYGLFTGKLQIPPSRVSYNAEAAFSFEGFDEVWVGLLPDEETELFVRRCADAQAAAKLAALVTKGFASYADESVARGETSWAKDRYLGRYSAAKSRGTFVFGVKGAESAPVGESWAQKIVSALD